MGITPAPKAPTLQRIDVTPRAPSITDGSTQQFIATGRYSNGSSQDLTATAVWTSSDPTIAVIISGGQAKGQADGSVTITATDSGVTGSTTLIVTAAALIQIAVAPATFALQSGLTQQFAAAGLYEDSTKADLTAQVAWSSSDPSVATVSDSGLVTGVAGGTVVISVASGELTDQSSVTITALTPPIAGTPADYLRQAQQAMFQLLLGNKPSRVDTPQLGSVEFTATTPAQLQRAIDYLQGLVMAGNTWPIDGSAGSMSAGYTRGRKPFSFFGWP